MKTEYVRTNYESRRNTRYPERARSSHYHERKESKSTEVSDKNFYRMVACCLLLIAVMAVRIFAPEKAVEVSESILPIIEADYDYKGAITAIGEAISGEESVIQVLGDLYSKAFNLAEGEGVQVSEDLSVSKEESELSPVEQLHETALRIGSERIARLREARSREAEISESTEQADMTGENSTAETTDEVVAAFLLAQEAYSDYALPSNVTYDKPALGITYSYPIVGEVSSEFGYRYHPLEGKIKFHYGTDIMGDVGDDIASFADGTVTAVSDNTVSGLNVTIAHSGGITTRYCHCSEIHVSEGDKVSAGDIIAAAGATGNVTGPHLHLELRVNGVYVNPEYYLNFSYT